MTTITVLGTGTMGAPMARRLSAAGLSVVVWNRTDTDAVATAVEPALDALADGATWLQMSTVGAAGADRLSGIAAAHGVTLVDAPVLGSREQAEDGALVVLASGPAEGRARVGPVLGLLAERVVWLGDAGAGSRLEVVVNAWLMSTTAALGECVAPAEQLGVSPEEFLDVTGRGGSARSIRTSTGPP
jgi:3-hydroxyisobutyrate dehydrogenase